VSLVVSLLTQLVVKLGTWLEKWSVHFIIIAHPGGAGDECHVGSE